MPAPLLSVDDFLNRSKMSWRDSPDSSLWKVTPFSCTEKVDCALAGWTVLLDTVWRVHGASRPVRHRPTGRSEHQHSIHHGKHAP